MNPSQLRLIVDSNVLIDLHWGGVLKEFFALPYGFFSPDIIIDELGHPDGEELLSKGLQCYEMDKEGVQEVSSWAEQYPNIASSDLFALVGAKKEGYFLLTGDKCLRKLAEENGITVHGTIWVLDEMVRIGTLKPVEAACALRSMVKNGSRLPTQECEERLRRWEK
jgi:rRNA-processing protein FCF1